jgi:hypothetical protein
MDTDRNQTLAYHNKSQDTRRGQTDRYSTATSLQFIQDLATSAPITSMFDMFRLEDHDGSEPSVIMAEGEGYLPRYTFYMDDIFSGATCFENMHVFMQDRLLPRLVWAKLELSFKKMRLCMLEVDATPNNHSKL